MDEELFALLSENECLLADGFDEALIGITGGVNAVAVYDIDKCLQILEDQFKDDSEDPQLEAIEFFEFNVICSYVGEKTPIFMYYYQTLKL